MEVSIIVDGKLHIKNRSTGRTQSLEVNFHKHWDTLQKTTRDKGHKWEKLWNIPGTKWETLRHLGHWDTPKGGARKIEKSGKVESPGWSECTCDTAVIPVGYLCTHCVPLKLESESTSGAVQASQSWPRRCLQRSHCPTDWCRLCCWHCLGSLAPLKPS